MESETKTYFESEDEKKLLKCWWQQVPETQRKNVCIRTGGWQVNFDMEKVPELLKKMLHFYVSTGYPTIALPKFKAAIREAELAYRQGQEKYLKNKTTRKRKLATSDAGDATLPKQQKMEKPLEKYVTLSPPNPLAAETDKTIAADA